LPDPESAGPFQKVGYPPISLNDSANIRDTITEEPFLKIKHILSVLLAISVIANIELFAGLNPVSQQNVPALVAKTNQLSVENMQLQKQVDQANISMQNALTQLNFYRAHLFSPEEVAEGVSVGLSGSAMMEAPAVSQVSQLVQNGLFLMQQIITNGSIMNISADLQPGKGRVLVETTPLMGIVFQDAANTAVFVAENKTKVDISGSDILFSIHANKEISSIDGPSAGALMTLVAIAALENRPIDQSVTLTGTIDQDGHIGAIGGAIEKAQAAKASGIRTFLLPRDNQMLTVYSEQTVNYGGLQVLEQVPRTVPAKEYIEQNVGIHVM